MTPPQGRKLNGSGQKLKAVQPGQVEPGALVQAGPLVTLAGLTGDGKNIVTRYEHPTGTSVFVMDPDHCEQFATKLLDLVRQARTGLTVVEGAAVKDPDEQ